MHPHTKQLIDEFRKNFKDFAFNSKTHFGRMADSSAILNFCEKEVHQALLSQAKMIRAEMDSAIGSLNGLGGCECCISKVNKQKANLDELINSFK